MKKISIAFAMITAMLLTACKSSDAKTSDSAMQQPSPASVQAPAPDSVGDATVLIKTSKGDIKVRLYGDTPRHRDNFVKLAESGYYDGVLFHRVIRDFMVQTGDPNSKNANAGKMLGSGDPGYTIEAEFVYPKHFHKKGALAAARTGDQINPERRSSGSQFYIVTGQVYTPEQLDRLEQQQLMNKKQSVFNRLVSENRTRIMEIQQARDSIAMQALEDELVAAMEAEVDSSTAALTPEQREAYTTIGGTPHLDGTYTVFGEVVEGLDVIDAIQQSATDSNDRPLSDIRIISTEVLK